MPIITLTTDFGETDHFVGVMKGVILSIAPRVTVVDISHQVAPYAIEEGAFLVSQSYPYFPKGTIHVAVVDPGVGTTRRPILLEAAGQYFIGPDNGLLSMVYQHEPKARVRWLNNRRYFLPKQSTTFHGRDIFAPTAAHLAAGVRPASLGKRIDDYLRPAGLLPTRAGKRHWSGTVLKVDRFGNLITNLSPAAFPDVLTRPFELIVGVTTVDSLIENFAQAPIGSPAIIVGSSGYLEVVANQASAAKMLGCAAGSPVELTIY